jgi:3-deoxy-7-phosphoheptulonate synthase/chorismate mutase
VHGGNVNTETRLSALRDEIDRLNEQLLAAIQKRGSVVLEIAALKRALGLDGHDAKREEEMLQRLTAAASEPFGPAEVREIFKAIFRASLDIQNLEGRKAMRVLRKDLVPASGFLVGNVPIGGQGWHLPDPSGDRRSATSVRGNERGNRHRETKRGRSDLK